MRRWKTWGFRIIVIALAVGVTGVIVGLPWRIHELGSAIGDVTKNKVEPAIAKASPVKRECDPAHESAGSFNGVPYLCTAEGKLVIDKDLVQITQKLDKKHDDLYWALRTRVLTDDEMAQVRRSGTALLMHGGETYSVSELEREFNGALLLQFQMRLVAEEHKRVPKDPMSGVPCVLGSLCNKTPSYMELPHGGHVDPGKERIR